MIRAEEDAGLAGSGLGREVGLPFGQLVPLLGHPAGHVRRVAVAQRPAQNGQRETVDLQEDDARRVRACRSTLALRDTLDDPQRVRIVVVRPEDDREDDANGRSDERRKQRPSEVVDRDRFRPDLGRQLEHERVEDEHEHEPEQGHEREPQRRRRAAAEWR